MKTKLIFYATFLGIAFLFDLYLIAVWIWISENKKFWNLSPMPAFIITALAFLVTVYLAKLTYDEAVIERDAP